MIAELIQHARSVGLSGHEAWRQRPVHWFIDLDEQGNVVGFSPTVASVTTKKGEVTERRGKEFRVSANYHTQWKEGKVQSVCTNQHNWLPDFLRGPVDEVFPRGVDGTSPVPHKRRQFWRLVHDAYIQRTSNPVIGAVWQFLRTRPVFLDLPLPPEARANLDWFRKKQNQDGETISFRVAGRVALADPTLRTWWEERVNAQRQAVVARLHPGTDAYGAEPGPVTEYFPTVFANVPFASFNADPFVSYGLGSQTATFRLETAELVTAGLNHLASSQDTSLPLNEATAVFWTAGQQQAADFLQLLERPDPWRFAITYGNVWGASVPHVGADDFHVAVLLKGTGRFSVRSWHTDTLANADRHVRRYFEAIELPPLPDRPDLDPVRLRDLVWATIAKAKGKQKAKPPPATFTGLFECAWRGTPVPHPIFAAAIDRQRVEMAGGDAKGRQFWEQFRARVALVQLYFALKRSETNALTTMEGIMNSKDTAILCGRLLALLDEIHNKAHDGKSASSPANTLYGAAAATPALVFPRLCTLARYHLQKMDKGMAYKLEFGVPRDRRDDGVAEDFEGLVAVVAQLKEAAGSDFPRLLSLEDQGRFALGFYYERARRWPNFKKTTDSPTGPEQTPEKEA